MIEMVSNPNVAYFPPENEAFVSKILLVHQKKSFWNTNWRSLANE